ncbi:hypothetical protein [Lysobacter sp. H21R4]|uniref:hypothetical protein n=1 Tax=Lysobacter sp. H21R4 TaxID=2781021 RepID=UPI001E640311|nr:hypothetical protein [Lysobacter sp. H21R4]
MAWLKRQRIIIWKGRDTAAGLARHFGGDAASWLSLQNAYDLKTLPNREEIERSIRPREVA